MGHIKEWVAEVVVKAESLGMGKVSPVVLSQGGHLIVHLFPHPVVARLAIGGSEENDAEMYRLASRELEAANYLHAKGVPVLLPANREYAVPHEVGGSWMTLWTFVPVAPLSPLTPQEAVNLVDALSTALKGFPGQLPELGIWEKTERSASRLREQSDFRIRHLLDRFDRVNDRMRGGGTELTPCHGDAHARNLLAGPEGWLWLDFEDVCKMPAYWDRASFVANLALFEGPGQPVFRYAKNKAQAEGRAEAFSFAIAARLLMSTLGNLDYALRGYGDLDYADKQLRLASDFIDRLPV
ncbi:phosphotransferase [Paenibacillus sp. GCM10027627]|uniref:phosphotransferase n=1 Tax=unclassified Paenibacillus TaxID=185978 RepID=UPI00363876A0